MKKEIVSFFVIAVVIIIFLFGYGTVIGRLSASPGQFGDMFGAANALFSGLAFTGVICAIFMQQKELNLQRRELELTRQAILCQKNELSRQADSLATQVSQFKEQQQKERELRRLDRIIEIVSALHELSERDWWDIDLQKMLAFGERFDILTDGQEEDICAEIRTFYDGMKPALARYHATVETVEDVQVFRTTVFKQLDQMSTILIQPSISLGLLKAYKRYADAANKV
jgi:hypothetical protein